MALQFPRQLLYYALLIVACSLFIQFISSLASSQSHPLKVDDDEFDRHMGSNHSNKIKASHMADDEVPQVWICFQYAFDTVSQTLLYYYSM